MRVTVRSALNIAQALGGRSIQVSLDAGADISGLLSRLIEDFGEPFRECVYHPDGSPKDGYFWIQLNGCSILALQGFASKLSEGDDVLILPAISGG